MPRAAQMRMRIRIGLTTLLACALLAPSARADRRTMIRAYEYMTQPQGNLELELWNDVSAPVAGGFDQASTLQRIELEYGLTDHWDLALYHVFGQDPGASLRFDSWRLETRYRLFEKNVLPVDVMLYFELERPANFSDPWVIEEKLILEKDFGRFALVANLVGEQKPFHGNQGYEWEIDAGARYEVVPQLRLGAEFWTIQETAGGVTEGSYYLGPAVSFASSKLWVQLGATCEASRGGAPAGLGSGLQFCALAPAFAGGARVPRQVHVLPPRVRAGRAERLARHPRSHERGEEDAPERRRTRADPHLPAGTRHDQIGP